MNKRGQAESQQLFLIIEIILGILVASILITSAANPDATSNVNKLYAQQDLSLLADSVDASPGDVTYDYRLKSIYGVSIKNIVTVTKRSGESGYRNITFEKSGDENQLRVQYG